MQKPTRPARARVLLVHGISEHSARHSNTTQFLLEHDIEVVRFDLRGAGRSGGRRQWVEKFEHYVEDTSQVFHWLQRELPPLPLFVLGHSLGGAISVYFTALYQKHLAGLILSAPAFQIGSKIPPVKIALAKLLNRWTPTLRVPGSSDLSHLSRDPEVAKVFWADPLSCHFNTVQQGNEVLRALNGLLGECAKIKLPVLIAHGSLDRLVLLEGSFQMIRALGSDDKTLYIIPGGYHEPHNDIDRELYFETMLRWIEKHLDESPRQLGREPAPADRSTRI